MEKKPELDVCDLVMQGGITSGLVYPGAVYELASSYRFENIGGASVGAIAAVATAAAEHGRQTGASSDFSKLLDLMHPITTRKGFLRNLFQPTPRAHGYFVTLLAFVGQAGLVSRIRWIVETILFQPAVAGIGFGGLGWILGAGAGWWQVFPGYSASRIGLAVTMFVTAIVIVALIDVGWLICRLRRILRKQTFGLCTGLTQPGYRQPALTNWLHGQVQHLAGLAKDDPLTFAMLGKHDIHLRMVTTDLSHGRPVILPLDGSETYYFTKRDMAERFPHEIVQRLIGGRQPLEVGDLSLYEMPSLDMPVTVAARLSLSFPILLSAVRLWTVEGGGPVEHILSDGGISSNFPIHFFDEWMPRQPTFGLSLESTDDTDVPSPEVLLSSKPWLPGWSKTANVEQFFDHVFGASRNWRDRAQAEMPSSRDRICRIFLTKGEGGLNLDMDLKVIRRLDHRGHLAGKEILAKFNFREHQCRRYLTLMRALQREIRGVAESRDKAPFQPGECRFDGWSPPEPGWEHGMTSATAALMRVADHFGPNGDAGAVFYPDQAAAPRPTMRIVPDV